MITFKNTVLCGHVTRVKALSRRLSVVRSCQSLVNGTLSTSTGNTASLIRMALNNNCLLLYASIVL